MRHYGLGLMVAVALSLSPWSGPAMAAEQPVYTIGIVPQFDLRRIQAIWGPITERLQAATGARFKLALDRDIPAFEKNLHAGVFDIAYMNPFHYVVASHRQGYRAIVRDVEESLYGIVVVRQDSPISSLSMLNGKVVAFPSPNAMGAALIPRAEFARKYGIKVDERYVKSHTSSYMNVLMGQADAAGGIWATFEQQAPEIRSGLRVLHETERYTPHPVAVHPRMPEALSAKIQAAFLALGEDAAGRELVAGIPMKQLGRAGDRDYDSLRGLGLEAFYVE
jgi:phosphonate transport system substrate-binding protein